MRVHLRVHLRVRLRGRLIVAMASTVLCLSTGLSGCAGASRQGSSGNGNVLTQEQLTNTNSTSLYDAILKLRPDWLNTRGPSSMTDPTPTLASVYMNGSMLGKVDFLRTMGALDVTEVRYWDAGRASARFGMGHPRGVIELTRR